MDSVGEESVRDMYTSDQVMKMLGISAATMHRWRKDGRLPYIEFPRKIYRYKKADIDKILREGV